MKNLIVFIFCLCCFFVVNAQSGFLKIEGIEGEATDREHKGWSDLLSFSQSIHKPGGAATGQTRRRGSAVLEDLVVVKELDKSSPKLQEAVCNGKVFPKVELHLNSTIGGTRQTYYMYELKNAMITSYSISGSDGVPTEEVSINFEEIKVTYHTFDVRGRKAGQVEYTWKVEKGQR